MGTATGASISLLVALVQGVPAGWKSQGKPGIGRGGVLNVGGVGGYPTAAANGLSQGKLQGKFEGSFMSIQSPSMSTPLGEKKRENSLFQ